MSGRLAHSRERSPIQPVVPALGKSPHQQSWPCILSIVVSPSRTLSDMCLNRQLAEALCFRRRTNGVLLSSLLKMEATDSPASRFASTLQGVRYQKNSNLQSHDATHPNSRISTATWNLLLTKAAGLPVLVGHRALRKKPARLDVNTNEGVESMTWASQSAPSIPSSVYRQVADPH